MHNSSSARTSSDLGVAVKDVIEVIKTGDSGSPPRDVEHHQTSEKQATDEPPDGGYGWVCVACCFWINAHTWGINSVCGPYR